MSTLVGPSADSPTKPLTVALLAATTNAGDQSLVVVYSQHPSSPLFSVARSGACKPLTRSSEALASALAVCVHPNGTAVYFTTAATLWRLHNGAVSAVAQVEPKGETQPELSAVACTSDGRRVVVCDNTNHRLLSISLDTGASTTIQGSELNSNDPALTIKPVSLVFDCTTPVPDSVLFVTTEHSIRMLTLQIGLKPHTSPILSLERYRAHALFARLWPDAAQVVKHVLQPFGVTECGWLLPELWTVVASYFSVPGTRHHRILSLNPPS